jgi:MerR family transcriptional regulator/heat shock protein HspR
MEREPTVVALGQASIKRELNRGKIARATLIQIVSDRIVRGMGGEAAFVISVAARLTGMHANTLRKYERERLLRPARTVGNLRMYSSQDMARLRQIKTLSEDRGVNVAGIRLALGAAEEVRQLRQEIAEDPVLATRQPEYQRRLVGRLDRVLSQLGLTVGDN